MKVVINGCYGGFSLSREAVKRYAQLKGRACYFFHKPDLCGPGPYVPLAEGQETALGMFFAFDVPNPNEVLADARDFYSLSMEERRASNEQHAAHSIDNRDVDRADADLVKVVEELGERADGSHAKLKVVEIPDGVEYELDEYDGIETVHEKHRSWA